MWIFTVSYWNERGSWPFHQHTHVPERWSAHFACRNVLEDQWIRQTPPLVPKSKPPEVSHLRVRVVKCKNSRDLSAFGTPYKILDHPLYCQ